MEINELLLKKYNVFPRFVEVEDASFILSLRVDAHLGRFLSAVPDDISQQEKWIISYKKREKQGKEFYFIFESLDGQKYGLSRIYNIGQYSFEIGSWLFANNSPEGLSVLADLATRDYAFGKFDFDYCRFEVHKANKTVVNYHRHFNPELQGEDEWNYYFKLSREKYNIFRNKLIKLYSHGIE